jgi:hypothetical protein
MSTMLFLVAVLPLKISRYFRFPVENNKIQILLTKNVLWKFISVYDIGVIF